MRLLKERKHQAELTEAKARWEADRAQGGTPAGGEIPAEAAVPAAPLPSPGLDIVAGRSRPSATGGDYFDYIPNAGREPGGGHRRCVRARVGPRL